MNGGKPRFHVLDLVRGLAVFLMLLAHSVYFFHARDNAILISLENLGNLFCFVAFLIVSGATTYISYLSHGEERLYRRRILTRVGVLVLSYYLIAIFVEASNIASNNGMERLRSIIDIILLRNLPSYTEYIVPFILYPLLVLLLGKFLTKLIQRPYLLAIWASLIYVVGYGISRLSLPDFLSPWQALLAGHTGVYRFPLFQYSPVFLLGLYLGKNLLEQRGLAIKKRSALFTALSLALIFAAIYYIGKKFGISHDILLKRWPPSPAFLLLSSALAYFAFWIFYSLKRLNAIPLLRDFLLLVGQNAYSIFWAHIFLLSIYKFAGGALISSPLVFLFMFLVLWLLVFALAIVLPFNLKFALNFHRFSREDEEEFWDHSTLIKFEEELTAEGKREANWFKRYFFPVHRTPHQRKIFRKRRAILIVVVSLLLAAILFPAALEESKSYTNKSRVAPWWDESFGYRQNITIKNKSPMTDIKIGQTLTLTLDHNDLVKKHIAKQDGSDMRLLYWDTKVYKDVSFNLSDGWNSDQSHIIFNVINDLNGGQSDNGYFLYFGNFYCADATSQIQANPAISNYSVTLSKITTLAINAKISKRWNLLDNVNKPSQLRLSADSNIELDKPTVSYHVIGTDINGQMKGDSGHYSAEVPLDSLRPGRYQVQVVAKTGEKVYSSQKEWFFLSYPLYVAWTFDWEGYDVTSNYLAAMNNIAEDYHLPMTHYWNARIYDGSMADERASYLTEWLKNRLKEGDGLGMHQHMFYDYVSASGLTPKNEPRWDDTADGYSVLTTSYTVDELKIITAYGLDKFEDNGLPQPILYRAGGWYANLDTLQAAAESGFRADSSGRTAYHFGKRNVPGPWNLLATSQPYLPSVDDQNTSSISNHLDILEIPNNGADSYWFSAEEMISRFKQNYDGSELTSKKQITYLSHPHWFKEAEQKKIRDLFSYIIQYSNSSDNGPVVFTTSGSIYEAFSK